MRRVVAVIVAALVLTAGPAMAQGKVEVSGIFGWTFSDGVTGDSVTAPDGNKYSAVDIKDSMNWGLMFGVMANPNVEIGFMFNQQQSALRLEGTKVRDLGDMSINSYHGYFGYNFGDADAKLRPYILGGIGATNYGRQARLDLGGDAVLDDVGRRGEVLPKRARRPALRHALDPDVHQERPGRLLVRLLGLLRHQQRPVRQPVRFLGRRDNSVLTRRKS
jgi:outer membrane protein W